MEIISDELMLKDLEMVEKKLVEINKVLNRSNNKKDLEERDLLVKVKSCLESKKWVRNVDWTNSVHFIMQGN
jgi:ribosome-binding ATPase YchF (GTP1/OBG family)